MKNFQGMMTIVSKRELVKDVFEMVLEGEAARFIQAPGQFINIKINDYLQPYLRRPMSICDYDDNHITMIFKVVGEGTKILSQKNIGDQLDCLTGLGNGFLDYQAKKAVVIGGGLGVPPMYKLAKTLKEQGVEAVSYTHLDVYKRQCFSKVKTRIFRVFNILKENQVDNIFEHILHKVL